MADKDKSEPIWAGKYDPKSWNGLKNFAKEYLVAFHPFAPPIPLVENLISEAAITKTEINSPLTRDDIAAALRQSLSKVQEDNFNPKGKWSFESDYTNDLGIKCECSYKRYGDYFEVEDITIT